MNEDWPQNISVMKNNESDVTPQIFTHLGLVVYRSVMTIILSIGFLGNVVTLVVLAHRKHRRRNITPYLINNAVANLLIVMFGYPVAISANLQGKYLLANNANCNWSSFVNGSTGIASIITLATLSFVIKLNVARWNRSPQSSLRRTCCIIAGIWIYATGLMIPPLLGWNRFVPGSARFSCCPDWTSRDISDLSYNVFLIVMGFVIPLTVIGYSFFKIWRFMKPPMFHTRVYTYRPTYGRDVINMAILAIASFIISWAPYCTLSIAAMLKGKYMTSSAWAQIPELMAKASVTYNPIILVLTYTGYRKTIYKMIRKLLRKGEVLEPRSRSWSATSKDSHQSCTASNWTRESRV